MTPDLFDGDPLGAPPSGPLVLGPGAALLRGFALPAAQALRDGVLAIARAAPWRHMETPGGRQMSVATTSCGDLGWVSDRRGYRYVDRDPVSGMPWPVMPDVFRTLACEAAAAAGHPGFDPDSCLVNRYAPGTRLSLHQDRDERDLQAPIVSVSLGLGAVFLWGGFARTERAQRVPLQHGDVVVWGGPDRLRFHGVLPVREGAHPQWGDARVNLTFRRAG